MCSFIPKNKFEKLVHLVGFIIRISHEARSPERQILMFWVIFSTLIKQFTPNFTSSQILYHLVFIVTATFNTEWEDFSLLTQSVSFVVSHLVTKLSPRYHL